MRSVTANAQAVLDQRLGSEWMVILEVEWVEGTVLRYTDQRGVLENVSPVIVEMGGFDGSMMLSGSGDSQDLSVTLDDIDGHLRSLYNSYDIHKRPASVYMLPKGLPLDDKILVFQGEIVTPMQWAESQRTMSFNILSKLEEVEVGFSMEEGDFPNIPDEALGKAWPLVFGQVCHLPAVKVRAPRRGILQSGEGIIDFTLDERICQALQIQCPSVSTGTQQTILRSGNNVYTTTEEETFGPDLECVNRRFGELCQLRDMLNQQLAYQHTTMNIYNGISFPQNQSVEIYVNGAIFTGVFSANSFAISNRLHPDYNTWAHQPCVRVPVEVTYGMLLGYAQIGDETANTGGYWLVSHGGAPGSGLQQATWVPANQGASFWANQNQQQAFDSCEAAFVAVPGMVGGPKDSWAYYDALRANDFFWAPSGSEVYMESESEILYIVSLLPGTVDGVAAYRTASNGIKYLTEVPSDYYTVYETDYQGYQVVEIGLNKALGLYDDGWDEQLYVSFTSSVGPNPCDIIEWLIGKYTNMTIDSASFASVKAALAKYPANRAVLERPDVFDIINDLAYQSRCAVYYRNNVVYIKYLSTEPASERTLTESDILHETFVESLSDTNDIYTTHDCVWQKAGATLTDQDRVEEKIILKYNVSKYGTNILSTDYHWYNIYDNVLKSATFWLIRKACSWKMVEFELPIKHMDLDVGDCVTLDVAQFGPAVKVVIEKLTIDPDDNKVKLSCWTPVRVGETEEYQWAWPALKSQTAVWPLPGDTNGGGGYNFTVEPPEGHILLGGSHRDDQLIISSGDLHPSDLDDYLQVPFCEVSDYVNFNEPDPILAVRDIATSAARQNIESAVSGGSPVGNANTSSKAETGEKECGSGDGCNYKVTITWHTSAAQGQATALGGATKDGTCGGPCVCKGGCPSCFGPIWNVCHSFGSAGGAHAFQARTHQDYGARSNGWWECNETRALQIVASNGEQDSDDCEDIGDAEPANDGTTPIAEYKRPSGTTGAEPNDPIYEV